MESELEISKLKDLGLPNFFRSGPFAGSFAVRVATRVPGSIAIDPTRPSDGFLVGFSSICTHMGCQLAGGKNSTALQYARDARTGKEQLVCGPCPCHGTSFDLLQRGLVVLGPATQNLSQLDLAIGADGQEVKAKNWLSNDVQTIDPREERWPA